MPVFTMPRATSVAHRRTPARRRALLAATAAAGLVLCSSGAASAHVRVVPESTTAGGFSALTFRVPTESETAGTVGLRVELPTATPFTSVRTKPLPGWTAVVERGPLPAPVERDGATITEAATAIVWTADAGTQVGPGQFQEFDLPVGPLPDAGTEVLLPATQTYSDGEVVRWADEPTADGSEPELPAPVLVTTEGADAGHAHGGGTATTADAEETGEQTGADAQPASDTSGASSDGASAVPAHDAGARWMGGAGLVLGAAALVTAALRGRRSASSRESA
jgi:uncharacterized protein YcnI